MRALLAACVDAEQVDDQVDVVASDSRPAPPQAFRAPAPWEWHFDDAAEADPDKDATDDFDERAFLAGKGSFVRRSVDRDLNILSAGGLCDWPFWMIVHLFPAPTWTTCRI